MRRIPMWRDLRDEIRHRRVLRTDKRARGQRADNWQREIVLLRPPRTRPCDLRARVVHEDPLALQTGQFADSDDYVVECEPAETSQTKLKLRGIQQNISAVEEPATCGGGVRIWGIARDLRDVCFSTVKCGAADADSLVVTRRGCHPVVRYRRS
jgi:hypothetical protein